MSYNFGIGWQAVDVSSHRLYGHGCGDNKYEPPDEARAVGANACMDSFKGSSQAYASSCLYARDGECNEAGPAGQGHCDEGTDFDDCAGPIQPIARAGGGACDGASSFFIPAFLCER